MAQKYLRALCDLCGEIGFLAPLWLGGAIDAISGIMLWRDRDGEEANERGAEPSSRIGSENLRRRTMCGRDEDTRVGGTKPPGCRRGYRNHPAQLPSPNPRGYLGLHSLCQFSSGKKGTAMETQQKISDLRPCKRDVTINMETGGVQWLYDIS